MALPDSRIVSLEELRFRPANSNDRARAGLDHAFTEVPPCAFAGDDGISHYLGVASEIDDLPDGHANQPALHDDVPQVGHDAAGISAAVFHRLGRGGFALSIFLHAVAAIGIGYFTVVSLPDEALLAGETVVSLELLSDSDVDAQMAGDAEQVDAAEDKPVAEEPKSEEKAVEPERLVEQPVVQARPSEPLEEQAEPVTTSEDPDVLATDQPSTFAVEQAARTILDTTGIEPLPQVLPAELVAPTADAQPEARHAKPLPHPISKLRPVRKRVETKDERKPEPRKEEPLKAESRVAEKQPETKKPVEKKRKVKGNGGADQSESTRGQTEPRNKGKQNQDASEGGQKNRETGNAATSNYKGLVQRKLERAKKRVRVAGKGSVTVSFTITANGSVTGLRVRKSSGKPAVDKGALDVVRKAAPFPAIPSDAKRASWSMSVPMTFK